MFSYNQTLGVQSPKVSIVSIEAHHHEVVSAPPLISSSTQALVFHALGGSIDWFQRSVVPHIRYWSAHVSNIVVSVGFAPMQNTKADAIQQSHKRPAIEYLIEQGLHYLERWRSHPHQHLLIQSDGLSPAIKLMKLHQAIIDGIWCLMQSVEIEAQDGSVWRLGETVLQVWFERHRPDCAQLRLINEMNEDIWREAIQTLLDKGIWGPSPSGRWLPHIPVPLLLWPLAGRDLQQTLCGMGFPEYSTEFVRRSLKYWGYTNPDCLSGELFSWIRPDGKTFYGMRASSRLMALMGDSGGGAAEAFSACETRFA